MRSIVLRAGLVVVVALAAAGCKSKCRQLSEKQCDCTLNSADKDTCLRRASTNESNIQLSAEDERTCEALLPGCDCRLIDTPEGKVKCGLARPLEN